MSGAFFARLLQDGTAYGAAIILPAAAGIHIDGVKPDMFSVQDAKPRSHHAAFNLNKGYDRLFWDGLEHGRDNAAECRVRSPVQPEERLDPFISDPIPQLDDRLVWIKYGGRQI